MAAGIIDRASAPKTDQSVGLGDANYPKPWCQHERRFLRLKLEVRSSPRHRRNPARSRRWQQPFFDAMQVFPRRLGERRIGANNVADHLPRSQVQRAFRSRPHRQRHRALRTETDALCGRFLPRLHAHGLREQIHGNRFLSGLELPAAAKTK